MWVWLSWFLGLSQEANLRLSGFSTHYACSPILSPGCSSPGWAPQRMMGYSRRKGGLGARTETGVAWRREWPVEMVLCVPWGL